MTPRVTVAIPLHASARWVDSIVENVRRLPPLVTEILISDQTCLDEAAERLRTRLADDPRVVVRAEPAGLGFAEHYQQLLNMADGEFFMWMPHDDIFEDGWVPTLYAALLEHPRAWLAFGTLHGVEADGFTARPTSSPRLARGMLSHWDCVRLMGLGWAALPFRGLMRRREILASCLRLMSECDVSAVDKEWTFRVALRSGLVYDERAVTRKRYYPGSTSTTREWTAMRRGSDPRAAVVLLDRHGPRGATGLALRTGARLLALRLAVRRRLRNVIPEPVVPHLRRIRTWLH